MMESDARRNIPLHFDKCAEEYDRQLSEGLSVTGETKEYFARERVAWMAQQLEALKAKPASVLDYGCGTGGSTQLIRAALAPKRFMGVDVDLLIHSDTLEHIPDSVLALRECWRVLKPGGQLFYTVPVIKDRLTRRRQGLPPSYHGAPGSFRGDFKVETEYGADFWCEIFQAGFQNVTVTSLIFPASFAIHAAK